MVEVGRPQGADTPLEDGCGCCYDAAGRRFRSRCICPPPMSTEDKLRAVAALGGDIGDAVRELLAERDSLRAALATSGAGTATPPEDRCPSCDHLREFHSDPGCWFAVTTGTVGHRLNCACTVIDWPRAALASGGTAAPTDEDIARAFHAAYERLAPDHGYETRAATARPWADVPAQNRALMIATVHEVREWLAGQPSLADLDAAARTPQPAPDGEETP